MPSSSEFSESSSGRGPAARSSINHRCNLLSQYLKEKGGFGDLSLGMTAQGGEAMGFFPKQRQIVKSMDLFPSKSGFGSAQEGIIQKVVAEDKSSPTKAETAQMTLFYGGQVIVFDDFPVDKANEVMLLASMSSSQFFSSTVSEVTDRIPSLPRETSNTRDEPAPARVFLPIPRTPEPIACDLPLARRNSLHRFLEKRKDRITVRAPYPKINGNTTTSVDGSPLSKPVESNKSWLSLSALRHHY